MNPRTKKTRFLGIQASARQQTTANTKGQAQPVVATLVKLIIRRHFRGCAGFS
jgi:predicted component of type VI protein secretion system